MNGIEVGSRVRIRISPKCPRFYQHLEFLGMTGKVVQITESLLPHGIAVLSDETDQYGATVEDFRAEELEVIGSESD